MIKNTCIGKANLTDREYLKKLDREYLKNAVPNKARARSLSLSLQVEYGAKGTAELLPGVLYDIRVEYQRLHACVYIHGVVCTDTYAYIRMHVSVHTWLCMHIYTPLARVFYGMRVVYRQLVCACRLVCMYVLL